LNAALQDQLGKKNNKPSFELDFDNVII